jgi:hypothetical protein
MRHLIVFGFFLLAGCAAGPTMEQLEDEAMQTGDWSKVEQRELLQARRMGRARTECPQSYALLCVAEANVGSEKCKCVSRDTQRGLFDKSISNQPPNPRQPVDL